MEVDQDGNPTKSKVSKLTVASDKQHGLLGKAELDLSKFGKDDFITYTLQLESCEEAGKEVEGATIEVALKGVENSSSPQGGTSPNASADGNTNKSILAVV